MTSHEMKRELINPSATRPIYDAYHFSQGNRVGNTIWVSGQVGLGPDMQAGKGMSAQAELAFESLKAVLAETGADLADVVELTTFHTDLRGEMADFAHVKDRYFTGHYPAWTAVGVTQLALPDLCIEIRAVAVAGSGRS